jgi:hypothetical protein
VSLSAGFINCYIPITVSPTTSGFVVAENYFCSIATNPKYQSGCGDLEQLVNVQEFNPSLVNLHLLFVEQEENRNAIKSVDAVIKNLLIVI